MAEAGKEEIIVEKVLCAICNDQITHENDSEEHIIPNSIGGRKTVRTFICTACNKGAGEKWDAELAKQLNPLSLLLSIKRDRGRPPPQVFDSTGDERLKIYPDGSITTSTVKFKSELLDEGKKLKLDITVRNQKGLDTKLKELKSKYPTANFDSLEIKSNSTYLTDKINIDIRFGGDFIGKTVIKSVMALAVDSGVRADRCELGLDALRKNGQSDCFSFFYEKDLIQNRADNEILHIVSIKGCSKNKLLLGYVEYFEAWRMVVCLSRNYLGNDIEKTYAINPITGKESDVEVNIDLMLDEVIGAYVKDDKLFELALQKVKYIIEKSSYERDKAKAR